VSCRLHDAYAISEALDTELRLLFPGAVRDLGDRRYPDLTDEELTKIEDQGIDADPRDWSVKGVLSGGQEFLLEIGSRDMRRLFGAMQRLEGERYFVFDSGEQRVLS
jgi:hypothetical protein